MKTWVRKSISVGVMAAGGLLVTQAAAQADVITTGNFGIGNGTQVVTPITTVADVCGNAISAAGGVSFAACDGGASVDGDGVPGDVISSGNFGIGNGTQLVAPVTTVLDVCGNSISAVAGVAFAACDGGASVNEDDDWDGGYYSATAERDMAFTEGQWNDAATNIVSSGNYGILNGTQVYAPITTSINLCGNSIAGVAGVAFAGCEGGAEVESARAEGTNLITTGNYGIGNGTQAYAPVTTVLNVCGNAISAAAAVAFAGCEGGAAVEGANDDTTVWTSNNYGIANGTQVYAPVTTVADISGNAIAGVGGVAFAGSQGGAVVESASAQEEALPALGQLPLVAGLPVVGNLGQQAAPQQLPAVPDVDLGQDARSATTEGYGWNDDDDDDNWNGGGTNLISSGNFGIGNGTQVFAPITTVADISGNAIAAAGGVAFAQSVGGAAANL